MSAASFFNFLKDIGYPHLARIKLSDCEWLFELSGDAGCFMHWLVTCAGKENILTPAELSSWKRILQQQQQHQQKQSDLADSAGDTAADSCQLLKGAALDSALIWRRRTLTDSANTRLARSHQQRRHLADEFELKQRRLQQLIQLRAALRHELDEVSQRVTAGKRRFDSANEHRRRLRHILLSSHSALSQLRHQLLSTADRLVLQVSEEETSQLLLPKQLRAFQSGEQQLQALVHQLGRQTAPLDTLRRKLDSDFAADIVDITAKLEAALRSKLLWQSRVDAVKLLQKTSAIPDLASLQKLPELPADHQTDCDQLMLHTIHSHVHTLVVNHLSQLRAATVDWQSCQHQWAEGATSAAKASLARAVWIQLGVEWQCARSERAAASVARLQLAADKQLSSVNVLVNSLSSRQHRLVCDPATTSRERAEGVAGLVDFGVHHWDRQLAACCRQFQLPADQLQLITQLTAALERSHVPAVLKQLEEGCHRLRRQLNLLVREWQRLSSAGSRQTPLWAVALVRPAQLPEAVARPLSSVPSIAGVCDISVNSLDRTDR